LLGLQDDALVLGSVAGTDEYKGWLTMAQAVAGLDPGLREKVRVVVAGKPPSRNQLDTVAALGMSERVVFPGLLQDVRPWVRTFDVGFVLSHGIETISFACREMMAMGIPVIVSRYAGLPDNIEEGVDGWVVPPKDPVALAALLGEIVSNRASLAAMGRAARSKSVDRFSFDSFIAATERVYHQVLSRRARGAKS
jgi:glycosyltransferase involved in cell wall biosynthesis